jgi:nucleoside-diphosphate-sugar epimerase
MQKDTILVIGSSGQLGTELVEALRNIHGSSSVIESDLKRPLKPLSEGPFEQLDVLDEKRVNDLIKQYRVTQIYHLAALLSATAEKNPKFAWKLNMDGLFIVLDAALEHKISKVYWPSSIAVFGPGTPREHTPQNCVMDPNTIYGISKLAGERYCEYYFRKKGLDVRSLRYPGLIGHKSDPGGGTTDYAVTIYHEALAKKSFECFLSENTELPMLYMPDALKATIGLMEAPAEKVKIRSSYNLAGMSFSPKEIAAAIKKHIPEFNITYKPDSRQQIADSWPKSIDDSEARKDWGWKPDYDLGKMTSDMLENLSKKVQLI